MPISEDVKASSSSKRREEEEEEVSETEEMSEDDEYVPSSDSEDTHGGSEESESESEGGSDFEEAKRQDVVLKRKRKAQVQKEVKKIKVDDKRMKKPMATPKSKPTKEVKHKKTPKKVSFDESKSDVVKTKPESEKKKDDEEKTAGPEGEEIEDPKKSKKKEPPVFNDKNLDYNLFNDAPENVVPKKIKISNTVLVTCKMIDAITGGASGGLSYDYAALTFLRKIQNQKAFEFNLPLSLAPNIIEALKLIMKDNPKFFKKHLPAPRND